MDRLVLFDCPVISLPAVPICSDSRRPTHHIYIDHTVAAFSYWFIFFTVWWHETHRFNQNGCLIDWLPEYDLIGCRNPKSDSGIPPIPLANQIVVMFQNVAVVDWVPFYLFAISPMSTNLESIDKLKIFCFWKRGVEFWLNWRAEESMVRPSSWNGVNGWIVLGWWWWLMKSGGNDRVTNSNVDIGGWRTWTAASWQRRL